MNWYFSHSDKWYLFMQGSVNLNVTFKPQLETYENMTCRLGEETIPSVSLSNKIQCTIKPKTSGDETSDDRRPRRSTISCNVSAIQYINCTFLIICK